MNKPRNQNRRIDSYPALIDMSRAISSEPRAEILSILLACDKPMKVGSIVDASKQSRSRTSQILGELKQLGAAVAERKGMEVYYSISPLLLERAKKLLEVLEKTKNVVGDDKG